MFDNTTLAKYSFKVLNGKTHTSNLKDLPNESKPSGLFLTAQRILGEEILFDNPSGTVAAGRAVACTGTNALNLVLDNTSNGKAYFVKVPSNHPLLNYKNPFTGTNYQVGDDVHFIITQQFGDAYRPILRDGNIEIPPLASQDWFLDPVAGVIVSEDNLGLNNGKLECYVYVGKMITEAFSQASNDLDDHINNPTAHQAIQISITDGYTLWFDEYQDVQNALDHLVRIFLDMKEPTGVVGGKTAATLSYSSSTETFTLQPIGTFTYYLKGKKVKFTQQKTVQITNPQHGDLWFIYFDDISATLKASKNPWGGLGFDSVVSIATVYVSNSLRIIGNELHSVTMDSDTHTYLHYNFGTLYRSGFGISGFQLNSDSDQDVILTLSAGTISDEDLTHDISEFTDGGFGQWYLDSNGKWTTFSSSSQAPFLWDSIYFNSTMPQYNPNGSGYADVPNGKYANYYLLATNMYGNNRVIIIPGQSVYDTLNEAQQENISSLLLSNFPIQESVPLYKITILANSSYNNTFNAILVAITDIRRTRTPSSAGVSSTADHNALTGRSSLNSHPLSAIGGANQGQVVIGGSLGQLSQDAGLVYDVNTDILVVNNTVQTNNIKLQGGTNFVTIQSNNITDQYTLTLPPNSGVDGYVLKTNGSGVLSWVSIDGINGIDEKILDVVGGSLVDSNTIDFTYDDNNDKITASVVLQNSDTISLTGNVGGIKAEIINGSILNAHISNIAAINRSKLANGTANTVVFNNEFGVMSDDLDFIYDSVLNKLSVSGSISTPKLENTNNIVIDAVNSNDTTVTVLNSGNGKVTLNVEGDETVSGTLTVSGDLIIQGEQVVQNVATVLIEDNMLYINKGENGNGVTKQTAGIVVDRGTATYDYAFVFNEQTDTFRIGEVVLSTDGYTLQVDNTQAVATREDNPFNKALAIWNGDVLRFDTTDKLIFDSGLVVDGYITTPTVYTNIINEKTPDTGVTVEGVLFKDGEISGFKLSTANTQEVLFINKNGIIDGDDKFTYNEDTSTLTLDSVDVNILLQVDGYAKFNQNSIWTSKSTTSTIDWSASLYQYITISTDTVFQFINDLNGMMINIVVTSNDEYTLTFPNNIVWDNGQAPLNTINGHIILTFFKVNDTIFGTYTSSELYFVVDSIGDFQTTPTQKGLSISGNEIRLHAASDTMPGAVSTGDQLFAGKKTFKNDVQIDGYILCKTAVRLEDPGTGVNVVEIKAPQSLANSYTLTLPSDVGSAGYSLTTDGNGGLVWAPGGIVRFPKVTNETLNVGDIVKINSSSLVTKDSILSEIAYPLGAVVAQAGDEDEYVNFVAKDYVITVEGDYSSFTVGGIVYWNGSGYTQTQPSGSGERVIMVGVVLSKSSIECKILLDVKILKINA